MGSVKDLTVLEKPTENRPGRGRFIYSDRYSVFDWGQMPDDISKKGEALCILTAYFFEQLESQGIDTHYRGLVSDGEPKKLEELDEPVSIMEVDLVRVIEPSFEGGSYDYSEYNLELTNALIPLEIIYRNYLPSSSSFRRRVKSGKVNLSDYGLDEMPPPGVKLETPIFDVSTKLEDIDRYISWSEAQEIAALSDEEIQAVKSMLQHINQLITDKVEQAGMQNADGKIELAFGADRQLMVVDALGTPDECRFKLDGFHVGKEVLRQYYRKTDWYQRLNEAKEEKGHQWRDAVDAPPSLPEEIRKGAAELYMACANAVTESRWFEVGELTEVIANLEKFIN